VYKIQQHKRKVPKAVIERRTWAKFGECRNDPPGPNPNNTSVTDDVYLVLTSQKEV
jgi:translation initiation factor 3 subunit G